MVDKVKKVMDEWKAGTLKSSSGEKVTKHEQAIAIALSEARKAGQDVATSTKTKRGRKNAKGR